jgi:hypothetical protein
LLVEEVINPDDANMTDTAQYNDVAARQTYCLISEFITDASKVTWSENNLK